MQEVFRRFARDARAIHLELDELIRAMKGARTSLVNLEKLTDEALDDLQREFAALHDRPAHRVGRQAATAFAEERERRLARDAGRHGAPHRGGPHRGDSA